jgi:hypothetical protein
MKKQEFLEDFHQQVIQPICRENKLSIDKCEEQSERLSMMALKYFEAQGEDGFEEAYKFYGMKKAFDSSIELLDISIPPKTKSLIEVCKSLPTSERDILGLRDSLGRNFALEPMQNRVFVKKCNGMIDYSLSYSYEDVYLSIKHHCPKLERNIYKSIMDGDQVEKVNAIAALYDAISKTKWDGKDRLSIMLNSLNLTGETRIIYPLVKKWFCSVYAWSFRDLDPNINYQVFTREVLILHSDQSKFGKTSFFGYVGFKHKMEEICSGSSLPVFHSFNGNFDGDSTYKLNVKRNGFLTCIDDIDNCIINSNGQLRAELTEEVVSGRLLYSNVTAHHKVRTKYCGTTNNKYVLNNARDNRYLVVTVGSPIDFESGWNDPLQLWAQIQQMLKEDSSLANFTHQESEVVRNLNREYLFRDPLEQFLTDKFEFNIDGDFELIDIKNEIMTGGLGVPNDKILGAKLKKLFEPQGSELTRRIGNPQKRFYNISLRRAPSF